MVKVISQQDGLFAEVDVPSESQVIELISDSLTGKADEFLVGDLTSTTPSLIVTSGTGAIIGSGTQISIANASPTDSGLMSAADKVKLDNIASTNTVGNLTSSTTALTVTGGINAVLGTGVNISVANATGVIAGLMTPSDKTKLDTLTAGATANSTDAFLLARANHTGTQLANTISDFSEAVDDRVGSLLVAGTNVTLNYDDTANTLTINSTGSSGATLPTGTINQTLRHDGTNFVATSLFTVNSSGNATATAFVSNGTGGNGFLELIGQSSLPSTPASSTLRLYRNNTGALAWRQADGFERAIFVPTITANRQWDFPDSSGTVMLTTTAVTASQLPSSIRAYRPIVSVSATKTLALTDGGTKQICSNSSAITITVPPESSVAWEDDTEIDLVSLAGGTVTIVAGSGVTINRKGSGSLQLSAAGSPATLIRTASNVWWLLGDLA